LGVTQEEMAQKLNIAKISYSFWEQGRRVPKSWQALNLALIYLYAKEQAEKNNSETTQNSKKLDAIKLFDIEKEGLHFPSLCRFIRKTLDVTQEEIAQKLDITRKSYTLWEGGKRIPKSWQALNLALIYLYAKEQAKKQSFPENPSQESIPKSSVDNN
ncbi:MAG: helix-turn-helix transcriptional regulator, partial [Blastocatellia bacterium]